MSYYEMIKLPKILPPSEDGVFKSTFTSPGAKPALLELLSDILDRPLKDVEIRNNELPINDIEAKREVFDINCVAADEQSQMDIEMQSTPMEGDTLANEHRHIRNRAVFNLCDLHASQPGRGIRYADLHNSYQITICNYKVFNWENELVERFTYRNESGKELSGITTAIFIDLTQADKIAKKPVEEMNDVEQWVMYFTKGNDPSYQKAINTIIEKKEGISVAYQMLTSISTDEIERAHFRSRRMWQMDRDHEIAEAQYEGEKKGRAEGEKKGRAEGRTAIAKKMLKASMSFADIAKLTELSEEEIRALDKESI